MLMGVFIEVITEVISMSCVRSSSLNFELLQMRID
jgi:hypothetical protein